MATANATPTVGALVGWVERKVADQRFNWRVVPTPQEVRADDGQFVVEAESTYAWLLVTPTDKVRRLRRAFDAPDMVELVVNDIDTVAIFDDENESFAIWGVPGAERAERMWIRADKLA